MLDLLRPLNAELPPGIELLCGEIRGPAAATLSGAAPASLPKPPELTVVEAPPPEPTTQIFLLQGVQWIENGARRSASAYKIVTMPPACAERAMLHGVGIDPRSPRAIEMRQFSKQPHIFNPAKRYDLDVDAVPQPGQPAQPAIEQTDRGGPYTVKVAGPNGAFFDGPGDAA